MTRIYYGQNREDIILESFFVGQNKGFYVDVGGYDPEFDSVTKRFYDKGWSGINIEPQPERHALFVKKRPRDINLNVGISNKNTTLTLRSYANQGLSTFSEDMKNEYKGQSVPEVSEYKDISIPVETLESVFRKHNVKKINFMKIDVEGLEYEVIEGNDWTRYRPQVLCIEANHIIKDWRPILLKNNYLLFFNDGLNEYYIDKKIEKNINFKYVDHVVLSLGGGVRFQDSLLAEEATRKRDQHINKLEKNINHQQAHIINLEKSLNESNEANQKLIEKIQQQNSLKWVLKRLIHLIKRRLFGRHV